MSNEIILKLEEGIYEDSRKEIQNKNNGRTKKYHEE